MRKILPSFRINVAYRSVKVSQLFSTKSKVTTARLDTPNVVYKMQCSGPKCHAYIGQTERQLIERIKIHSQPSQGKGILLHLENCAIYLNKFETYLGDNGNPSPHSRAYAKLRLEFLASHFTILEKNLANWKDRMAAEAYYIRAQRPLLNGQKDHERFSLF